MRLVGIVIGVAAAFGMAARVNESGAQEFPRMSLQEPRTDRRPSPESKTDRRYVEEPPVPEVTLSLQGRYFVPLGSIDIGENTQYSKLFDHGLGLAGELSYVVPVGRKWHIGPYLSLGWDTYDGRRAQHTVATVDPEDMDVITVLAGVRFLLQLGRYGQMDLHVAMGTANYLEVQGMYTSGGVTQKAVLFESTTSFAFDFGLRFNILLGEQVYIDLGFDVRPQGGPRQGDIDFDIGTMVDLGLEFGLGIRF